MVNPGSSLTSQFHCIAHLASFLILPPRLGTIVLFCMSALDKTLWRNLFELCKSSMMHKLWSGWVSNIKKDKEDDFKKYDDMNPSINNGWNGLSIYVYFEAILQAMGAVVKVEPHSFIYSYTVIFRLG